MFMRLAMFGCAATFESISPFTSAYVWKYSKPVTSTAAAGAGSARATNTSRSRVGRDLFTAGWNGRGWCVRAPIGRFVLLRLRIWPAAIAARCRPAPAKAVAGRLLAAPAELRGGAGRFDTHRLE